MQIPKTLKIGGHTIKVIIEKRKLETTAWAHADKGKNEIVLDGGLPQSQMESTLIHEILHLINNPLDHALLDSLAEQLYQVLKDNNLLR